jgi:hypothetical protein
MSAVSRYCQIVSVGLSNGVKSIRNRTVSWSDTGYHQRRCSPIQSSLGLATNTIISIAIPWESLVVRRLFLYSRTDSYLCSRLGPPRDHKGRKLDHIQ